MPFVFCVDLVINSDFGFGFWDGVRWWYTEDCWGIELPEEE